VNPSAHPSKERFSAQELLKDNHSVNPDATLSGFKARAGFALGRKDK
jgi:hypothetical protein